MPPAYFKKHMVSVENFVIAKYDCLMVFHTVKYDGADHKARQEKWKLVGQWCLSRVCSKRCSWWSKLDVRAAAPIVCNFTTVAEEQ
jgi:hypothetical protein